MLSQLVLKNSGPMQTLSMTLAPRLNMLTGDNSLGKSFLLEVVWWALTDSWAGIQAIPHRPVEGPAPDKATMAYELRHRQGDLKEVALQRRDTFDFPKQKWRREDWTLVPDSPRPIPRADKHNEPIYRPATVVVYARVDGGFALYDSYRQSADGSGVHPILLEPKEVFAGKKYDPETVRLLGLGGDDICNGLIRDWVDWEARNPKLFETFLICLTVLSKYSNEPLKAGAATRVGIGTSTFFPTLNLPYGNVPIHMASAGMRRVLALAYMLVWTWQEHERNAEEARLKPVRDIVLLVDEVEAHLHPQWQRALAPALMEVIQILAPAADVQAVIATHSPLVLASLEPKFDVKQDALWKLDLVDGEVKIEKDDWHRRGEVGDWLTSDVFDLKESRSIEAERAIQAAIDHMRQGNTDKDALRAVTKRLGEVLSDTDGMWVRWSWYARKHGVDT